MCDRARCTTLANDIGGFVPVYNQEFWRFHLAIANPGDDLRFAIRYEVNGETFWDNNLGRDYVVATT